MFWEKEGKLIYSYDGETVCIEAWGKDALRVRATKNRSFTGRDWALEAKDAHAGEVEIFEDPSAKGGAFANMYEGTDTSYGKITNGKLHAVIDSGSVITFYHEDGRVLLKEHFRRLRDEESMPLNIMGREYSQKLVFRTSSSKKSVIFLSYNCSSGVMNSFKISMAPLSDRPNLPSVWASSPQLTVARHRL